MFNRYCDRLDKKQPDSERGGLWVWPRFEPLTPSPWFLIRWRLSFFASQPSPVSVSGLIPSLSAAPVPCWCRKCQNQIMVTQTVREYPHQLGCQTLHYKTLPWISPICYNDTFTKPHWNKWSLEKNLLRIVRRRSSNWLWCKKEVWSKNSLFELLHLDRSVDANRHLRGTVKIVVNFLPILTAVRRLQK